jgi:O-methyltransferase
VSRPSRAQLPGDAGVDFHSHPEVAASLEQARANFRRFGLLDDQVIFPEGWFRDSMVLVDASAVLRFDGDTYESTVPRSASTTVSRREVG